MGRGRDSNGFTPHDYEVAAHVMTKSKIVREWAQGLLKAFGLEPDTPEGKRFLEKKSMEQAQRIVR